ncbi:hypothetical protein H9P43_006583 [Blastocladiella emersonii ATCC 22665]|nr:hypothetical protein H9P43_006583 [Blastocladiella emersonii ATCC 22665]
MAGTSPRLPPASPAAPASTADPVSQIADNVAVPLVAPPPADDRDRDHAPSKSVNSSAESLVAKRSAPTAAAADSGAESVSQSTSPMLAANIFSRLWYSWCTPLMRAGYHHPLQESDLLPLGEPFAADRALATFLGHFRTTLAAWQTKVGLPTATDRNPALHVPAPHRVPLAVILRALYRSFGTMWVVAGALKVLGDATALLIPVCVARIVAILSDCQASFAPAAAADQPEHYCNANAGFVTVALMFACQLVSSVSTNAFWHLSMFTGLRVRTALVTAIFDKALKLSNAARAAEWNVGKVVNLVSTDCSRLSDQAVPFFHQLWTCPLQVTVAMILMVNYIGWAALVGFGFLALFVPLQGRAMAAIAVMRRKSQRITDRRVKLINELLQGIKIVKLLAWERPFLAKVEAEREKELYYVTRVAVWKSAVVGVAIAAPAIAAVCAFSTYAAFHPLVPSLVFGSLSLLNLARMPLWQIPQAYAYLLDAQVALRRITNLLVAAESEAMPTVTRSDDPNRPAIAIDAASFTWELTGATGPVPPAAPSSSEKEKLGASDSVVALPLPLPLPTSSADDAVFIRDLDLRIPKGALVSVVGKVGSGKSSLLSAMIGEMERVAGSVAIDGRVAYCPQIPFILNDTLRANVTFGAPFDEARYNDAIYYSALHRDLAQLPGGDASEVGQQGLVLSGGQRARTTLARALFASPSILLADDILAALDQHVAAFVFHKCLRGHLAGTTRVLATHNLAYAAQCDLVLYLEAGRIVERGTIDEIMARGGAAADLFREYAHGGAQDAVTDAGASHGADSDPDLELEGAPSATAPAPAAIAPADEQFNGEAKRTGATLTSTVAAADTQRGKVTTTEERELGAVRAEYYSRYVAYAGGWLVASLLIAFVAVTQGVRIVNDIALVWWANDTFGWTLDAYIGFYVGLGVTQAAITVASNVVFVYSGVVASRHLHQAAVRRLVYAPLSLFEGTPLGRILSRLSKDVDVTDYLLIDSFRMALRSLTVLLSIVGIMISATPFVAIVVGVLLFVFYYVQRFYRATSRELKRLESLSRSPLYAEVGQAMASTGLATIRAFGEQDRFRARVARHMDRNNRPYFLSFTAARWLGVRIELLGATVTTACGLFAVLFRTSISPSLVGLTLSYALQMTMILNNNVFQIAEGESQMNSVERLVYTATSSPQERGTPGDVADRAARGEPPLDLVAVPAEWPSRGEIVIDNLQLAYGNGIPVLRGLTMRIPAGARVGVVGRTGAGKSSLLSALLRMVEPTGGSVVIDGVDVSRVSLHDLRSRIAVIPQEPVLFEGTVRENIDRYGEYDDAAVWDVLERAGLRDTVAALDGRLDAYVGENGENWSLGERSCLCLARAMLVARRIVCMDEASAAIDLATEQTIQESIRSGFKDVTVFIIAHRLNTVVDNIDFVAYLEGGRVAEFAPPHELLQRPDSLFRALVDETGPASAQVLYHLEQCNGGIDIVAASAEERHQLFVPNYTGGDKAWPNVVQVCDAIVTRSNVYIFLELARGRDLYRRVQRPRLGPYSESSSRLIAYQLLRALEFLHGMGIVHRDIKPDNIPIEGDAASDEPYVRLADFGVAHHGAIGDRMTLVWLTMTGALQHPWIDSHITSLRDTYDALTPHRNTSHVAPQQLGRVADAIAALPADADAGDAGQELSHLSHALPPHGHPLLVLPAGAAPADGFMATAAVGVQHQHLSQHAQQPSPPDFWLGSILSASPPLSNAMGSSSANPGAKYVQDQSGGAGVASNVFAASQASVATGLAWDLSPIQHGPVSNNEFSLVFAGSTSAAASTQFAMSDRDARAE